MLEIEQSKWNDEANYLIRINFWWRFWRVQVAQGRWFQVVFKCQKALGMMYEGVWMFKWDGDGLELKNWYSNLEGEMWVCNNGSLALEAWLMHGTPSPIYREGVGVVRREKWGCFFKKGWSSKNAKRWSLLNKGG